MNNHELDRMLKEWGERNRPDADTLARLEADLREAGRRERSSSGNLGGAGREFQPWLRWTAMAAGLAVLLAGGFMWKNVRESGASGAAGNGASDLARIPAEQLASGRAILDELDALFDGQLRWVRLDAKEMHLGMKAESARGEDSRTRLVVRTVIMERETGRTEWKPIWSADVLTRADEYVAMAPDDDSAGELELWVHRLPDGRYVLDSEIQWPAARLVRPYEAQVFCAGQPQQVFRQTSDGREYRIYQAIEALENGQG